MGVEHLLDLEARDVLAPPANAVLDAVDVVQAAEIVETPGVAGVKPQVAPRLDGPVWHPEVAGHDATGNPGPHHDLPDLARRKRVVALGIDDTDLEPLAERIPGAARH